MPYLISWPTRQQWVLQDTSYDSLYDRCTWRTTWNRGMNTNLNTQTYSNNTSNIQVWCDRLFRMMWRVHRTLITSKLTCARARVRAHVNIDTELPKHTWITYISCYSQLIGLLRTVYLYDTRGVFTGPGLPFNLHTNLASLDNTTLL
jgi:hypothetical protein